MYSRANQSPQSIFLTTKTSVYPNLVAPPHSDEKPINKVREAGKARVINKGYQIQWRIHSVTHDWVISHRYFPAETSGAELRITQLYMRKHMVSCSLQTSTSNPYSRGSSQQTVPSSSTKGTRPVWPNFPTNNRVHPHSPVITDQRTEMTET